MVVSVAEHNRAFYERRSVCDHYAAQSDLHPAEKVIFEHFRPDIERKEVLDIGVGGGRTASYISEIAARYQGIDYSHTMVAHCREKFPHLTFLQADARDLNGFGDGSFDFVLFSFNGIDYADDVDRKRILREVLRVLRPSGLFAFSTHNLDVSVGGLIKRRISLEPRQIVKYGLRFPKWFYDLVMHRQQRTDTDGYAIVAEQWTDYRLQTYYIGVPRQVRQLTECGIRTIAVYDDQGQSIASDKACQHSQYLWFICKK